MAGDNPASAFLNAFLSGNTEVVDELRTDVREMKDELKKFNKNATALANMGPTLTKLVSILERSQPQIVKAVEIIEKADKNMEQLLPLITG